MLDQKEKQKGISIFLSLLITTVFLSVGIGLVTMFQNQREITEDFLVGVQSRAAAETGIEHAMYVASQGSGSHPHQFTITGKLEKFPGDPVAEYTADYYSLCKEIYVSSTGAYKKGEAERGSYAKRTLQTGEYKIEVIPYGASCKALADLTWTCPASIGTDEEALNSKYWESQTIPCFERYGNVNTVMQNDGEECSGRNSQWSYCRLYRVE